MISRILGFLTAGLLMCHGGAVAGDLKIKNELDYRVSLLADEGELHRLRLEQHYKKKISKTVRFEGSLLLEFSDDDVGVGEFSNYSSWSKPIIRSDDVKLEINELKLQYKLNDANLTLGKQVVAWGVLDSIRITDIINPSRLNEFVFIEDRPDRIGIF